MADIRVHKISNDDRIRTYKGNYTVTVVGDGKVDFPIFYITRKGTSQPILCMGSLKYFYIMNEDEFSQNT
jgi:hypothetical protein